MGMGGRRRWGVRRFTRMSCEMIGFHCDLLCIGGVWVGRRHISFHITASSEEALHLLTHVSIIIQPPSPPSLSLRDPPFRFHPHPPSPSSTFTPPQNPTKPNPSPHTITIDTIAALNLTPPPPLQTPLSDNRGNLANALTEARGSVAARRMRGAAERVLVDVDVEEVEGEVEVGGCAGDGWKVGG